MRLITVDDLLDVYIKLHQRGGAFLLSKFNLSASARTKSSFDDTRLETANWWIVPAVRKRWNKLITGQETMDYESYITRLLADKGHLCMISIGSGSCSHELRLARLNPHWSVTCLDFSPKLMRKAELQARETGVYNMQFVVEDVTAYHASPQSFDLVLFHASLHHFSQMYRFIQKVDTWLRPGGCLIINEYVGPNRLQFPGHQIDAINQALSIIPARFRTIFKTGITRQKFYGHGTLRMLMADPSECVESANILPAIHQRFETLEEKGYGGNLLMPVLKDISHHFLEADEERMACLSALFQMEDDYLKSYSSDFVFGIYRKQAG